MPVQRNVVAVYTARDQHTLLGALTALLKIDGALSGEFTFDKSVAVTLKVRGDKAAIRTALSDVDVLAFAVGKDDWDVNRGGKNEKLHCAASAN